MREELITSKTANLAREKGFDLLEGCTCGGFPECICQTVRTKNYYYIPTQSLLQKWIREEHKYHISITYREVKGTRIGGINSVCFEIKVYHLRGGDAYKQFKIAAYSDEYEVALEYGLQETLKLIK